MKRVLFVDDEASVLESLRDALRPWRREWRSDFACGGQAALERLATDNFDVVVSDMRMPGMDGAALLRHVRGLQPHAVRIVLSGSTERDVLARAADVAHRFLAKPCDVDELARIVTHAGALGRTSRTQPSYQAASTASALPCAPVLYGELSALLATENASVVDVARVVERDVAVTAKLLQLINSAFIGYPTTIVRVEEAVSILGLGVVKAIVLSTHVLSAYRPDPPIAGFSIEALEAHATLVAALARKLLPAGPEQEHACAAAMLQDIGWLVLAAEDPERIRAVIAAAQSEWSAVDAVERGQDGPTHADVGAHLLALWGLPDPIVSAVAHHHAPLTPSGPGLDVPAAVYVAGALITELSAPEGSPAMLDADYIAALGVSDRVDAWRALAGEFAT